MGETAVKDEQGLPKVYSSPKPWGTTAYYTGSGDDPELGIGKGARIMAAIASDEGSRYVDLYFNETVYIRGGFLESFNAPWGSYMDFHIYHRVGMMEVATYARKVWLYGNNTIELSSDDRAPLTTDFFVRMSIHNSDPENYSDHEPMTAFKMTGVIEMFRTITYNT